MMFSQLCLGVQVSSSLESMALWEEVVLGEEVTSRLL